jgi:sec-independent protein translocase protein TatA
MGPIGAQEMFLIFILALLLFGPKKLPELGRMLGKGLTEFRRAKNELKTTFESHMQELERETKLSDEPDKPAWEQTSNNSYSSASYPYSYDEYGRHDSSSETTAPAPVESSDAQASIDSPAPAEAVPGTVPRSHAPREPEPVSAATDENRTA